MKLYQYTLLKQDGTKEDLGTSEQRSFKDFYRILECQTIELIPSDYWKGLGYGRCNMYGDDEGRLYQGNHTNPHFNVIHDPDGNPWDVVGDIIMEKKIK